jgi:hypothetical protein
MNTFVVEIRAAIFLSVNNFYRSGELNPEFAAL